ncbi:MAG: septum formation initiator family protein [Flavihumibacter sp.]
MIAAFIEKIPSWLRNKYVLCTLVFVVWIVFFDDRDIITTHFRYKKELNTLENSKHYYEQQIAETSAQLGKLTSNPASLEKYAREQYKMKKDNEDLYLVEVKNQK